MNLVCTVCLLAVLLSLPSLKSQHLQHSDEYVDTRQQNMNSNLEKNEVPSIQNSDSLYQTWIFSLIASCVIGLSGVVPLVLIPAGIKLNHDTGGGSKYLRLLLSFAVGGLLGDVFLHLLPEAWNHQKSQSSETDSPHFFCGISVLLGMFSFVILEMIFTATETSKVEPISECNTKLQNGVNTCYESHTSEKILCNSHIPQNNYGSNFTGYQETCTQNGHYNPKSQLNRSVLNAELEKKKPPPIHIAGYLNLMANSIDNFTHGLAVAASFLVGCKMGVLTTFAILIHEIPHEIGDFAILLRSGFHPWTAAKAQISTATIGMLGVVVALSAESIDKVGVCTSWILPFTAGGFLNIALVNVLPELLDEKDPWESVKQVLCVCTGIAVMACVGLFV